MYLKQPYGLLREEMPPTLILDVLVENSSIAKWASDIEQIHRTPEEISNHIIFSGVAKRFQKQHGFTKQDTSYHQ